MMPPRNETESSVSRITRGGKQITYKMSVMQQPERARACGAGAKCKQLPTLYLDLSRSVFLYFPPLADN